MNLASREIETKLADMKKSYLELLKVELPNWSKMTHTELANNYLESTDDDFRGICFIALLIKSAGSRMAEARAFACHSYQSLICFCFSPPVL